MGVPKFFSWLSKKYPGILSGFSGPQDGEKEENAANALKIFDNVYLDMNGILHNCAYGITEAVRARKKKREHRAVKSERGGEEREEKMGLNFVATNLPLVLLVRALSRMKQKKRWRRTLWRNWIAYLRW